MKLMIAVVQRQDAGDLVDALTARSHRVTRISSEGGFLREGNVTLLIAVEDEHIDAVMRMIHTHCHMRVRYISPLPPVAESGNLPSTPVEVQVGGATVFVLNAESVTRVLN